MKIGIHGMSAPIITGIGGFFEQELRHTERITDR